MKNFLSCTCGSSKKDEALLFLRVVTGFLFFYHGYTKVFVMGMDNVVGFFSNVGIPAAGIMAYLVAYGELLGGIALMIGFLTHWVSKINILIMLGAIFFVHFSKGYGNEGGYEYQLLILAVSVFFMVFGPGKYSIDARCKKSDTSSASEPKA